jgi:thiol-disulfide isomerase/thioredoxin
VGVALMTIPGCGLLSFDADHDGLSNGEEEDIGSDPQVADSDGDAMSDGDEVTAGLDPLVADTDGDRLLDGHEAANGADPLIADTDDDGYLDGDEVTEGHDPNDKQDRIYKGKWPYYWDKDSLKGGGNLAEVGKRYQQISMVDQHGDTVDLWDFYNSDKPVIIDISAEWCGPCNGLALWLDGGPDTYGFGTYWPAGPEVIERGDVYWVTILQQDMSGLPATQAASERWFDAYPSKEIPVLADSTDSELTYAGTNWFPTVIMLNSKLKAQDTGSWGDAGGVLLQLNEDYPE